MKERDDLRNCDRCVWAQRIGGCASWDCEFIDKWDAAEAWRREQKAGLTDDDIETIRIHLSAMKEDLCNQHRWTEARYYQSLIARLMAFTEHPEGREG